LTRVRHSWQVGAPPEVAALLEEIGRERCAATSAAGEVGLDPELDEFMVRAPSRARCHTPAGSTATTASLAPIPARALLRCYYM
jgi:hypothetical protein